MGNLAMRFGVLLPGLLASVWGWAQEEERELPPYLTVPAFESVFTETLPEPESWRRDGEFTYNPGAATGTLDVFEIIGVEARLTALRYLEGRYFATTDRGSVLVSKDLKGWREYQLAPKDQTLVDIAYVPEGEGFFVILQELPSLAKGEESAAAAGAANLVSPDGIRWARIPRVEAYRDGIRAVWAVREETWLQTASSGWNASAGWRTFRKGEDGAWEPVDLFAREGVDPLEPTSLLEGDGRTIGLMPNGWVLGWKEIPGKLKVLREEPLEVFTPFATVAGGGETWILSATGYTLNDTILLVKQGFQPWGRLESGIGGTAYVLEYGQGRWVLTSIGQTDSREWKSFPPRHRFSGGTLWTSTNGFDWEQVAGVDRFTGSLEASPAGFLMPGPRGQFLVWSPPSGGSGESSSVSFRVETPYLPAELSGGLPPVYLLRQSAYARAQLESAEKGEAEGLTFVGKSLLGGRDLFYSTPESGVLYLKAAREAGSAEASWVLGRFFDEQDPRTREAGRQLKRESGERGWWAGQYHLLREQLEADRSGDSLEGALNWAGRLLKTYDTRERSIRQSISRAIHIEQLKRWMGYASSLEAAQKGEREAIEVVTRALREEMAFRAERAGASSFLPQHNQAAAEEEPEVVAFANWPDYLEIGAQSTDGRELRLLSESWRAYRKTAPELNGPDPDRLFRMAAEAGDAEAFQTLFNHYMQLDGEEAGPSYAKAVELLQVAIENGFATPAYLRLFGVFLYQGLGVEEDRQAGLAYLEEAAKGGDWDAVKNLHLIRSKDVLDQPPPEPDGRVEGLDPRISDFLAFVWERDGPMTTKTVAILFNGLWEDALLDSTERDLIEEIRSGEAFSIQKGEEDGSFSFQPEFKGDARTFFSGLFPEGWEPRDSGPLATWIRSVSISGPVFFWGILAPEYEQTFIRFFGTHLVQLGSVDEQEGKTYDGAMEEYLQAAIRDARSTNPLYGYYYLALLSRSLKGLQERLPYNIKIQNGLNLITPVAEDLQAEAFEVVPEELKLPQNADPAS